MHVATIAYFWIKVNLKGRWRTAGAAKGPISWCSRDRQRDRALDSDRGVRGALRMGLVHGAFCVGCCWFLMGLLFFGGVMDLYWIAGATLFILFEK